MKQSLIKRIQSLQHSAMAQGFKWNNGQEALEKVREECDEIDAELNNPSTDRLHEEVGDVLIAAISLASTLSIDAESALEGSLARFENRWARFQNLTSARDIPMHEMTRDELHDLWCEVKRES